jgi:hypothetical protein
MVVILKLINFYDTIYDRPSTEERRKDFEDVFES